MKTTFYLSFLFVMFAAATMKQDTVTIYPEEVTAKNCPLGLIRTKAPDGSTDRRFIGCNACKSIPEDLATFSDVETIEVDRILFYGVPIVRKIKIIPLED